MTTKSTEVVQLLKPAVADKIFLQNKKQMEELVEAATQFPDITDETQAEAAVAVMSNINEGLKALDIVHSTVKKPYLDACRLIDERKKLISGNAPTALKRMKDMCLAWENEKDRKAEEERETIRKENEEKEAKARAHMEAIETASKKLLEHFFMVTRKINECTNLKVLHSVYVEYIKGWKEFADENLLLIVDKSEESRQALIRLGKLRDAALKDENLIEAYAVYYEEITGESSEIKQNLQDNVEEQMNKVEGELEMNAAEAIGKEIAVTTTPRTITRKLTWESEVVNFEEVPDEWKLINKTALSDYITANKATLKDGVVINGVKFFQKQSAAMKRN